MKDEGTSNELHKPSKYVLYVCFVFLLEFCFYLSIQQSELYFSCIWVSCLKLVELACAKLILDGTQYIILHI